MTDVCSFNKLEAEPDTLLGDALELMADHHISSALIFQAGELLRIFTATDARRYWAKHLRGEPVNKL